jgi:pimeloyl-ACP methyl ester carboxylesterase
VRPTLIGLSGTYRQRTPRANPAHGFRHLDGAATRIGRAHIVWIINTIVLAYAKPGKSYDVGGYRLHLTCVGTGSPTVVLVNGLSESSPFWSRITPVVGRSTRVCAYDRAGQGWSEDAPQPVDGLRNAADLHILLERAGENGQFILVGRSSGGTYAMTYAAQHPAQVAGMVLLDSASPYQVTALPDFPGEYAVLRRVLALPPADTHGCSAPGPFLPPGMIRRCAGASSG